MSARIAGDLGSIPWLGRYPGKGNGNPLQYSCLENPMDGGTWWAAVHEVSKSRTRLSDFTFTFHFRLKKKNLSDIFRDNISLLSYDFEVMVCLSNFPNADICLYPLNKT